MSYESWRISFQSSEQAARAAYAEVEALREQLRLATVDQATAEAEANDARAENERLREEVERLGRLVQERDAMLGRRLCSGTNADGKPRCLVLAEERARAERLAEALRDARRALAFAAQHLPECNEPYERANAALAQEDRNG